MSNRNTQRSAMPPSVPPDQADATRAAARSVATDTPMTVAEFARLDSLERRIKTAWDEAALAWDEIKIGRLYRRTREDHMKQTWEQYCQSVHDITPQWANKLIRRAKTLRDIRRNCETPVSLSPTAVGHLEGLEPDEQRELIQDASRGGQPPTAVAIAEARQAKGGVEAGNGTTTEIDGVGEADAAGTTDQDEDEAGDEEAGDSRRWEREVAKAESEAAQVGDGGTTDPGPAVYKVTVMVFSESDGAAIHQALSKWSATTKGLGGSKQLRSVSAKAQPEQIGTLLQKLGAALVRSQPRKMRVSIEL